MRQGSFTGGQINAITKSGTNDFHGSLFGFYQGQGIAGNDTAGTGARDFNVEQYGGSVGGPIIENRLHFFAAGEFRHCVTPFAGPIIGSATNVGITADSAQAIRIDSEWLRHCAGDRSARSTRRAMRRTCSRSCLRSPATSGRAELSVNYAHGITAGFDLARARDQRRLSAAHRRRLRPRRRRGRGTASGRRCSATGRTSCSPVTR